MAEVVRMPKLSDTMTEGVVAKWHKKIGDQVKAGDILAEIETDKATMEFESFLDGTLLYIGVKEGESAPVDSILAILGEKGEDINAILEEEKKKAAEKPKETPAKETSSSSPSSAPVPTPSPSPAKVEKPQPTPAKVVEKTTQTVDVNTLPGQIKASPLAKKLAKERGINLALVRGTGDGGRIVKRDVENFLSGTQTFVGVERYYEVNVSQMRKTIARRLSESKFSAPHFYLTMEIDMDACVQARKSINEIASEKISFNDIVIKAVASSLRKHPAINSSWLGDRIRFNEHIHIGVAVAVEEGLLVPVVKFADNKTLSQISKEVKQFAQKAKEKKLQPQDMEGNTFTISNLGMFGIDEFTAIINPPDACILAVGGIQQKPVVKNGQIVPGNIMKVTLSCDHRVVDGATGAAFLQTLKKYLENPAVLLGEMMIG
ncbi:MAG: pyruvate dehydrogenase complex dihydrolipoamide acetyltransferase [Bacteroidetes bacterium]|nr:MAG: pyruvate dehydrogenase complex dihydrolipoamide acetyltransferase [Bacteroidota bacterium]